MRGDTPYANVFAAFAQANTHWQRLGGRKELMGTTAISWALTSPKEICGRRCG